MRVDRREKLACLPCDGQIVCAPRGDKIVEGGMYGLRLVAHLLVSKFADGLPAHRQREQLARLGLDLPVSTLIDHRGARASTEVTQRSCGSADG